MRVIQDDLLLCTDCLFAAVNGDFSGLDTAERESAIRSGLQNLGPNLVCNFDSETGRGVRDFLSVSCDCCQSTLAGTRHRFAILG